MTRALIRFSLLLFLISFVGLVGLNRGLDPRNVVRIQAHAIVIQISSNGGNTLSFALNATCNSEAMAPSDTCVATAGVQNTGEDAVTLSAPAVQVSGPLTTCGGGGWFSASVNNLSYTPNTEVIPIGAVESFNVVATLDGDTPNACQGLTAEIVITIEALATTSGVGVLPPPQVGPPTTTTQSFFPAPVAPATAPSSPAPVAEVQGTRTETTEPTELISEVLPSRFPATGSGGYLSAEGEQAIRTIFELAGLVGAVLLILTLALYWQRRRGRA